MAERAWERSERKLFVLVVRAEGLPLRGDHEPDTFCKLHLGKEKMRTSVSKRTVSPLWEEFFVFELSADMPMGPFRVEVREEKTFGTDCIGAWSLERPDTQLAPDEPHEKLVDLMARPGKKDSGGGRVLIRILHSSDVERRGESQALQADASLVFAYEEYAGSFKTGDLIAYSEPGIVAASLKLWNGIAYNRLGLVLALPNRWTERFELYVWEFTRNLDLLVDAFLDVKRPGCALFRLFDRLHQCHASHIAWVALRNPLDRFSGQRLVEHAWAQHTGAQPCSPADIDPECQLMRFLHKLNIPARRVPPPELHAVHHLATALKASALMPSDAPPPQTGITTAKHVLSLPAYMPARLIRSRTPIASTSPSLASPMALSPAPISPRPALVPVQAQTPPATMLPVVVTTTRQSAALPTTPRHGASSYAPSGPPPAYAPPQLQSPYSSPPPAYASAPAVTVTGSQGNYNINVPPPYAANQPQIRNVSPLPHAHAHTHAAPPPYSMHVHPLQQQQQQTPVTASEAPYADSFVPIRVDHGPPPVYNAPPPPPSLVALDSMHVQDRDMPPPRPSVAHSLGEYALADYLRTDTNANTAPALAYASPQPMAVSGSKPRAHGTP